jgi:hypothetical protein
MPLRPGKSKAAFSHNVKAEVAAGKPQKQAVAIAYRESGEDELEIECDEDLEIDCVVDSSPRLAMDRAPTARTKDPINGWLHVKDCRISKANVCPYLGREIPRSESLGLEPDKVYYLYRDAAALEAAAKSFERVPLVIIHTAVTSETAQKPEIKQKIIGAISNIRWVAPYLVADLTVWDGEGIEAIESERQCELSPGYHYIPEMNSGVAPDGDRYDGRMLSLWANHLAIVDTGRTGPDVFVNDHKLTDITET